MLDCLHDFVQSYLFFHHLLLRVLRYAKGFSSACDLMRANKASISSALDSHMVPGD